MGRFETIEHFGVRLELNSDVFSSRMIDVLKSMRYERKEARRISKIIQAGEIVLEIGAGIGFLSTLITKDPKTIRVLSYEANPDLIPVIRNTISTNVIDGARKHAVKNAILSTSIVEDHVDFFVHRDFWASSLLPTVDCLRVEKVPVEDFNEVIRGLRPTLIVCDIEGAEIVLFKNANLTGVSRVFMEIHQKKVGRSGIRELFEIMHRQGFHYDQDHSEGAVVLFSRVGLN